MASGRARAVFDPRHGGRLTSLVVAGHELIGGSEAVGPGPASFFSGCFWMAPYPGTLIDGQVLWAGRSWSLPRNTGQHAAHGLVYDRQWQVAEHTEEALRLVVTMPTEWPFGGSASLTAALDDESLTLRLAVAAETPSPAAVGFHPWFRRRLDGDDSDVMITFHPSARLPAGAGLGGATSDLGPRPWDDVFTGLAETPRLRWPSVELAVESDTPYWILCETFPGGVCVEPLSAAPNTIGLDANAVARPDRPVELEMRLIWSVRDHGQPSRSRDRNAVGEGQ